MPEVTKSSIEDVRLGTRMVGALLAGTYELYVRFEKLSYNTPGSFTFTLPYWATAYGVVMSGGGGGGQAGNGGNGNRGNGGQGGGIYRLWGRLSDSTNRTFSYVIGAGGAGGTSSHATGGTGGTTSITTPFSDVYTAEGGAAYPTMTTQNGGVTEMYASEPFHKYFNVPHKAIITNGPAGTGNGGSGTRGGGGAGGNGGLFNNYTNGGKGGDGFVDIYVWGLPRD